MYACCLYETDIHTYHSSHMVSATIAGKVIENTNEHNHNPGKF